MSATEVQTAEVTEIHERLLARNTKLKQYYRTHLETGGKGQKSS